MTAAKRAARSGPGGGEKEANRARAPSRKQVVPPYSPSWINRLVNAMDRLPGPAWAYYIGTALFLAGLQLVIQWSAGTYPVGEIDLFNVLVAVTVPYQLGLMHYLIRSSADSLEEFRPALRASEAEAEDLRYRLTTLPARPVHLTALAVTLASIALSVVLFALERSGWTVGAQFLGGSLFTEAPRVFRIASTPASLGLTAVILLVAWWATATFAYLLVQQLTLISHIYSHHTEIHFFRLGPLYAFSRQTLRSSVGLIVLAYALFATASDVMLSPLGLGSWLLLISGALATFLLPLLGIHRHLVREKGRRLSETGRRMETGIAELHKRIDARRLSRMDDLNKALASLEIERAAFERVPTWPWERGTLRSLVAALVVPVMIWLAQFVLGRMLEG